MTKIPSPQEVETRLKRIEDRAFDSLLNRCIDGIDAMDSRRAVRVNLYRKHDQHKTGAQLETVVLMRAIEALQAAGWIVQLHTEGLAGDRWLQINAPEIQ